MIGNHAPEFASERSEKNLREALARRGIAYPVVMDNDSVNWKAYGNRYWPTKYLIDKKGVIRFFSIGEGGHERTEAMILRLLAE